MSSRASTTMAVSLAVALPVFVRLEVADAVTRATAVGVVATVLIGAAAAQRWPVWWAAIAGCAAFVLVRLLPTPEAWSLVLFTLGATAVWLSAGSAISGREADRDGVDRSLIPATAAAVCAAVGLPWILPLLLIAGSIAVVMLATERDRAAGERPVVSARRLIPATGTVADPPPRPQEQPTPVIDPTRPRWMPDWLGTGSRVPVVAWLVVAVPVNLVQEIVHDLTQRDAGIVEALLPPYSVFGGRVAWDSTNFVRIATEGYEPGQALEASFPGYPLLVRSFMWVTHLDVYTSAVIVSAAGGLIATVLFWRWTEAVNLALRSRLIALALFLLVPASFVLFGVAYADSVMMAFLVGALLAVTARRDVLAGLLGAAATFTRPTALALVPALVVLVLERDGVLAVTARSAASDTVERAGRGLALGTQRVLFVADRLRTGHAWSLLPLAGIGCYATWMWRHSGDPLYFWTIQTDHYGHRPMTSIATWLKVEFINRPGEFVHNGPDAFNQVVATAAAAGSLLAIPTVGRRLGWGHAVLVLSAATILWATAMWFAPTRYLLPALPPLAVAAAEWLVGRRRATGIVLTTFAVSALVLGGAFAAVYRLNW